MPLGEGLRAPPRSFESRKYHLFAVSHRCGPRAGSSRRLAERPVGPLRHLDAVVAVAVGEPVGLDAAVGLRAGLLDRHRRGAARGLAGDHEADGAELGEVRRCGVIRW